MRILLNLYAYTYIYTHVHRVKRNFTRVKPGSSRDQEEDIDRGVSVACCHTQSHKHGLNLEVKGALCA